MTHHTNMSDAANKKEDHINETDTDPSCTITGLLASWDDFKLFQLTKFYRERLEPAMEGGVHGVSSMLTLEKLISGLDHAKVCELAEKGERAESSKLLLNLVMKKGSQARRVMWEAFVKIRNAVPKIDKILKEILDHGFVPYDYIKVTVDSSSLTGKLKDIQQKHQDTLKVQTEKLLVNTMLKHGTVRTFHLLDRYVDLTIISSVRDRMLVEHELLARGRDREEWREKSIQRELEKIRPDQLFHSSFSHRKSQNGSLAAVAGVAGIGKTTMVQKIVHDWATGKIYQNFQFVFFFKFRELNAINCTINLSNLIVIFYPYLRNILENLWENPEGLLFIFDGLDEFRDKIDFDNSQGDTESLLECTDPEFRCKMSTIVCSLIQHKLLPGCSVLVTTRPNFLHVLEMAEINVWAEILGFVGEERKEYFNRFFEDEALAEAVFKHVEENEIMYTMSCNPSCCWIIGEALGTFFSQKGKNHQQVPKSITQLYSYYIYNILKNHGRHVENPRDVLLKVGKMAFAGVSEKNVVFQAGDLIQFQLQPSQFLSGFLMELLEGEDSPRNMVYTFPHFTIQEFVAALAQFLTPDYGEILKLLNEAHGTADGRFDVFLRFVAGLSSPGSAGPLEEFLGPFPDRTVCQVVDWVREMVEREIENIGGDTGNRNLLNTLHYLFESQNTEVAQATVGPVETLSFSYLQLSPNDCTVLNHAISFCDTIKHLDLQSCALQCDGIQRLGPTLHKCQNLGLVKYQLGDAGVKPLTEALMKPDCKIQKMRLENNSLTASCAEDLVSAVTAIHSLTDLQLGYNKLGDAGVNKLLSDALKNPQCNIQSLGLSFNGLTASCAKDIASVLTIKNSLKSLNLSSNEMGDSGLKWLSVALRNPASKLQKLGLWAVGLTASCAKDLASILSETHSLTELDLGFNKLGDSGVEILSEALRKPNCKIEELGLDHNDLTASCTKVLGSALSQNSSLKGLGLCFNDLQDSGVKQVAAALSGPDCKIQSLRLKSVGLTDSSTDDLVAVLSNATSLKELDLRSNTFTDNSIIMLRRLITAQKTLEQIQLAENQFSSDGKTQLRALQGIRPKLNVII
ncbi:NACHT, LRR and PYD domains-containing protein 3-like isoform X2 [Narcine bancroftii]